MKSELSSWNISSDEPVLFYLKVENYSRGFCIEGFLVKVRNILIATLIISKSETEQEKLSPWKNVFVAQKQLMLMPSNERKKKYPRI